MTKKKTTKITAKQVDHVAALANLKLEPKQGARFQKQLSSVLEFVSTINQPHAQKTPETTQVTGLSNVTREDSIDKDRILSQEQALKNAPRSHKGYFVVSQIIDQS